MQKQEVKRDTWSNRQIWPWSTNEAGQRLTEFCQENVLVIANTLFQNHKRKLHMAITRWSILKSDWLSSQPKMEQFYTLSKRKTGIWTLRNSHHELLIAKFRLKLKKVGKTTRLFRYDLNQIPYSYTVEVTNRFKGLDLIRHFSSRMPEELRTEVWTLYRRQWSKPSPRNAKRQNGCLRRPYK